MLLRRLGDERCQLRQWLFTPISRIRIDGEVDARGSTGGVGDAIRHRQLHRHVLEVLGAGVEQLHKFDVGDGNLRDDGRQRPEEEAQARAVMDNGSVAEVADMHGR